MKDTHPGHDDDEQERCAKDQKKRPKCEIDRCKVIDGVCQQPKLKGCPCLKAKVYWSAISRSDLDAGQKIISEILGKSEHVAPKLMCDKDKRVNLEYADYLKLSGSFCRDTDLTRKRADMKITPSQAGTQGTYPNVEFSFSWKPTHTSCSASCTEIFSVFNTSTVCSYDSHTMAASGSQQLDCGATSYSFKDTKNHNHGPEPPPRDKLYCGLK
ncbi:hypothetical protein AC579_6606 [Pseudocercospora musae]|uniref:Uncharacterized protein n=1 Tax=Pseudocercospora musae TaxID=113226 RepID=A0A139I689_9PEZI|nr:hypothetical protein AC579_6606 [Pseudocercospora musae]